jgi:dihydroorotate dehydrogenase (NAD+) catalytic subunit
MNTNDALEFIIAGASAVQIGTANFTDPMTAVNVIDGIEDYLKKNNVPNVRLVTGSLVTG